MAGIGDFVWDVLGTGAVVTALLGIAAVLGRSQLAHWLNRDIERIKADLQKNLESEKAKHQQALESYRVSLIAEAERSKASQAVRTAVAVKFSEDQFTAMNAINAAYADLAQKVSSFYELATTFRQQDSEYFLARCNRDMQSLDIQIDVLTKAIYAGKLYLADEDVSGLHEFEALLVTIVNCVRIHLLGKDADQEDVQELKKNPMAVRFIGLKSKYERTHFVRQEELKITKMLRQYADRYIKMIGAS